MIKKYIGVQQIFYKCWNKSEMGFLSCGMLGIGYEDMS